MIPFFVYYIVHYFKEVENLSKFNYQSFFFELFDTLRRKHWFFNEIVESNISLAEEGTKLNYSVGIVKSDMFYTNLCYSSLLGQTIPSEYDELVNELCSSGYLLGKFSPSNSFTPDLLVTMIFYFSYYLIEDKESPLFLIEKYFVKQSYDREFRDTKFFLLLDSTYFKHQVAATIILRADALRHFHKDTC